MIEEVEHEYHFIRLKEVLYLTTIPKSTLNEMIKDGEFPGPVELSTRSRAWVKSEVKAWMKEKVEARDKKTTKV